jgi:hypothetical protein
VGKGSLIDELVNVNFYLLSRKYFLWRRGNSVGIATRLRAGR